MDNRLLNTVFVDEVLEPENVEKSYDAIG